MNNNIKAIKVGVASCGIAAGAQEVMDLLKNDPDLCDIENESLKQYLKKYQMEKKNILQL